MENDLRFSWLVKTIHSCSGSDQKPSDFLLMLIDNMLLDGTDNPLAGDSEDYLNRIFRGTRVLSRKKASKIFSRFNSKKFVDYLQSLGDDCLYNIESIIKSEIPEFDPDDSNGFKLAELVLFEIKVISETPRANENTDKIECQEVKDDNKADTDNRKNNDIDETEMLKAREFLLRYESEKSLMPLCQIALCYNPSHNHVRRMYTDYCLLSFNVWKIILEDCKASELLSINELYWEEGLSHFEKDLKTFELSSYNYIYMFGQYFTKSYTYADHNITNYDEYSFRRLFIPEIITIFPSTRYSSLDAYIDDYLYMKDTGECKNALCPMDYLILCKNLRNSSEEDLMFWLCRFVIDACNNLGHRIVGGPVYQECYDDDAETMEDMFFCAIYALHMHYLHHIEKRMK